MNQPPPPAIRSSTTRQQLQFHLGIGLGVPLATLLMELDESSWYLLAASVVFLTVSTIIVGGYHLSLGPVPKDRKRMFQEALKIDAKKRGKLTN